MKYVIWIMSPSGEYLIRAYYLEGDSLSGDSVRYDLYTYETDSTKTFYIDDSCPVVNLWWKDGHTVRISGVEIDVETGEIKSQNDK